MTRRLLVLGMVVAAIGVGSWLVRSHLTVAAIAAQESRLRAVLADRPLAVFLAGLAAYTLLSFVPLTAGKSLVFGWLFGLWQGVVIGNLGLTIAALCMFLLGRYVLREGLRSRFGAVMARMDRAIDVDGACYLFGLRVMHAPYTFLSYAMGATSMKPRSFWWATQAGLLPGNILFTYAGTQLPRLERIAERGWTGIVTPGLVAAFVLIGVFPLAVRWIARRRGPRAATPGP